VLFKRLAKRGYPLGSVELYIGCFKKLAVGLFLGPGGLSARPGGLSARKPLVDWVSFKLGTYLAVCPPGLADCPPGGLGLALL
jgi:hypothetical protein